MLYSINVSLLDYVDIQGVPFQSGQWKYLITLTVLNRFRKVFFELRLPFYNLFQLVSENNID